MQQLLHCSPLLTVHRTFAKTADCAVVTMQ